jgi:hypothetical protein
VSFPAALRHPPLPPSPAATPPLRGAAYDGLQVAQSWVSLLDTTDRGVQVGTRSLCSTLLLTHILSTSTALRWCRRSPQWCASGAHAEQISPSPERIRTGAAGGRVLTARWHPLLDLPAA